MRYYPIGSEQFARQEYIYYNFNPVKQKLNLSNISNQLGSQYQIWKKMLNYS